MKTFDPSSLWLIATSITQECQVPLAGNPLTFQMCDEQVKGDVRTEECYVYVE